MIRRDRSYPRLPKLDQGPSFHDRNPPRHECDAGCVVEIDGIEAPAAFEDFSSFGFKVRCGRPLMVGSTIVLKLKGCEPVEAIVRWAIGGRAGCIFRRRVSEDRVREALGIPADVPPSRVFP